METNEKETYVHGSIPGKSSSTSHQVLSPDVEKVLIRTGIDLVIKLRS